MPEQGNRYAKVRQKGRNLLFRILFGRTMVIVVLLCLQIVILFLVLRFLGSCFQGFFALCNVLSAALIVYIINANENPAFKLAWMIPICAFPVFGVISFLFIRANPGAVRLKKQIDDKKKETAEYLWTTEKVAKRLKREKVPIYGLAYYLQHTNQMPTYQNTKVDYFALGEEKFKDLLVELEKAEHFIFLEYFIISKGKMWQEILDILLRKSKEGVEVRILYDGMCALANLPYRYPKELQKMGLQAKMFSPIKPLLSAHQNCRDHRKILVIDGVVAYTGGINLSDEYVNEVALHGHWKDTAIKLTGDAVKSFTIMFLQMWNTGEKGKEDYTRYLQKQYGLRFSKDLGYVIPYNDDPVNREDVAEAVYLHILYEAKQYVHIMTPYLIIDHEMEEALMFAAKRGVDVKMILPHIPDKKIAFSIARTYYTELLQAGVKIYEYLPGFVHAKVFVSDDECAVVGTVNLDYRSMFEHFECAAFLYRNPVIAEIEQDIQNTLQQSVKVTENYYRNIPLHQRLTGKVFRIFASLM